jgi:hypothetical protein
MVFTTSKFCREQLGQAMKLMPRERRCSDFHFLDRVGRQRDANGIANPFGEQHTEAHGRFHCA